jgi:hypothetical protein
VGRRTARGGCAAAALISGREAPSAGSPARW